VALLQEQVKLGRVAVLERDYGVRTLNGKNKLQDYGIKPKAAISGNSFGPLHVNFGKETVVNFGQEANLEGWHWLGAASAGAVATFGKHGGFRMEATVLQRRWLPDTDSLNDAIRVAVKQGRLGRGKSIVIEVETAETAVFVASSGSGGSIRLKLSASVKPAGVTLASFAGGFTQESSSEGTRALAFSNPITTAFRAVTAGHKGLFFWRDIPIRIAAAKGDSRLLNQDVAEADFTDDDYYIRFNADDKPDVS
jgi:hypothetical protein